MKKVMLLAGFCSLLAACQSEKEPEYTTPSDSMPMYLEASIASDRVTSRTTVTEEGNSSFMETDRIGFSIRMQWKPAVGSMMVPIGIQHPI